MKTNQILLNQDGGAGGQGGDGKTALTGDKGAGGSWRDSLPDDLKSDTSLANIKDVASLAKSYVHAQRMIGADKILAPQKNWTDAQWADFWKQIGRPDSADGYTFKIDASKLPKGFNIDEGKFKSTRETLHKLGLTDKQATEVLDYYLKNTSGEFAALQQQRDTNRAKALAELKTEYGEKYDATLDVARSVLRKFGNDELIGMLEESGLGDNPAMIRLFAKIGEAMLDDTARGEGAGLVVGGQAEALAEIAKLKMDKEFQKALMERGIGHQEAVDRWAALHKKAFPEKK